MKRKSPASLTIANAVYWVVAHVEDGTDAEVIRYASKVFGKPITKAEFNRV
jgi:hypothetical protein